MPAYIVYENATGRIVRTGSASEIDLPLQNAGDPSLTSIETSFDGHIDDRAKMMDISVTPPVMIDRPVLTFNKLNIIADGIDEAVLSGLTNPTKVWVDGVPYMVTDGTFEFSTNMPATYTVRIFDEHAFPYQNFRAEVIAS